MGEMDEAQVHELHQHLRFEPDESEIINYYLPRLISGVPMHRAVDPLIHRSDVYAYHPADLAARFDHVPQCRDTGDRYFFTPCKRLKGGGKRSKRLVGDGSWVAQHAWDVVDGAGVKVGEHRTLVFCNKGKVKTDWLMDEFRCDPYPQPQEPLVDGAEMVMCRIHFSKPAAKKRPAPVAADQPWPCLKKMRLVPSPTPPGRSQVFAPPPPPAYAATLLVSLPEETAPAADDGDDRFVCSLDELLGVCAGEDIPAPAPDDKAEAEDQQAAIFASDEFGSIPTSDEFGDIYNDLPFLCTLDDLDMPPAEQQLPIMTSDESSS